MATVIKKGDNGELVRRLASFDLADHLAEARHVVASARREGQRILAEATAEADRIREAAEGEGYRAGYGAGQIKGLEEGRAEALREATERFNESHAELADSMAAVIESFETSKQDLLIEANRDLLEFAVALAAKITRQVGEMDRQAALANTEEALRLVGGRTDLTVRVHPRDGETLRQFASAVAEQAVGKRHVTVVEDESIAPGGAVVTAGGMEIDASLETQLEQITRLLVGS
jgi:flagellar assembly protein FliH